MNHERMLTLLIQDDLRYNAGFLIIVVDFSGFSTKHPEMLGTELTIDSPMTLYGRLHAGSTYPHPKFHRRISESLAVDSWKS